MSEDEARIGGKASGAKADYYSGPQAGDFAQAAEPFTLFAEWFAQAQAHEPNDPNAMALATVDAAGMPNVRMVLLKGVDEVGHAARGFVFYTNVESAKGVELLAARKAALVFHWKSLRRQVRVRGDVSVVSDAEADAYFASRARPTGRVFASRRSRWSSGTTDLSACTSASPSGAAVRARRGASSGCIRRSGASPRPAGPMSSRPEREARRAGTQGRARALAIPRSLAAPGSRIFRFAKFRDDSARTSDGARRRPQESSEGKVRRSRRAACGSSRRRCGSR